MEPHCALTVMVLGLEILLAFAFFLGENVHILSIQHDNNYCETLIKHVPNSIVSEWSTDISRSILKVLLTRVAYLVTNS